MRFAKWKYWILAFGVPFGGMLLVMAAGDCVPFGTDSMMFADMYDQYYPFFVAFRDVLRSGNFQNLVYNWTVGLGTDFLSLTAYYLMSPPYLFSIFLPENLVLPYFCMLVPVKLGLAGLSFAYLNYKLYGEKGSGWLFAGFYALCAWALGYQWNIMWLDTFALLPLAVLGTVSLLRDNEWLLYSFVLFFAIVCNYIMGFFTCVFILFFFIIYQICSWKGWKTLWRDLWRIALVSLLTIGMTAAVELPALMGLQTTQADAFPVGLQLNLAGENTLLGFAQAIRAVISNMGGAVPLTVLDGGPNLYCGVITIFLFFLYLMDKAIPRREKLCLGILLLFIDLSFIFRQLDYIWHGFHFTKMIPFRFSYLHCFVLLLAACRAWRERRNFTGKQVVVAALLTAALLLSSVHMAIRTPVEIGSAYFFLPSFLLFNGFFGCAYGGVLFASSQKWLREKWIERLMILLLCAELGAGLLWFRISFTGVNLENYPKGGENTAAIIEKMKDCEKASLFYRAEATHGQTQNDGALNRYYGASTFTSTSNQKLIEFMRSLGYSAKSYYNRYLYEEGSPVSDLFLGIKYRIERDGSDRSSRYFQEVDQRGQVILLENQRYLPLGFLAEKELAQLPSSMDAAGGAFLFQNLMFSAATEITENLWNPIPEENWSVTGEGMTLQKQTPDGYTAFQSRAADAVLTYSFEMDREGFAALYLTFPTHNSLKVSLNGEALYREQIGPPQLLAVGDVVPGDVVEVQVESYLGEQGSVTIEAAIMDNSLFDKGYDLLNASTLELTEFESTYVEGTISCDRDGLLYTSIPQNGNWKAEVDGEEAEIILVGDCMVALELTEGDHTVSFSYENKAFSLGWKISLVCAAVFLAAAWLKNRNPKPGRFQR